MYFFYLLLLFCMLSYQSGVRLSTAAESPAAVDRAHDSDHHLDQADDGENGVGCDSTILFDKSKTRDTV